MKSEEERMSNKSSDDDFDPDDLLPPNYRRPKGGSANLDTVEKEADLVDRMTKAVAALGADPPFQAVREAIRAEMHKSGIAMQDEVS
jgi:hypothetical protein